MRERSWRSRVGVAPNKVCRLLTIGVSLQRSFDMKPEHEGAVLGNGRVDR
jgi:hypothetical protein